MSPARSRSSHRHTLALPAIALGLCACTTASPETGEAGAAVDPMAGAGKADAADRVAPQGVVVPGGEARAGAFTEDLEFHGYTLDVRAGAQVALEITQKGSAKALDTTLYVYGPKAAQGYGTTALAFDDNAGWGALSKLSNVTLTAGGSYLVVVGTHDGRGRGAYRLTAACTAGACDPLPAASACPAPLQDAITACVADREADPDFDASVEPRPEVIAVCADAEVVAPAFDAGCADGSLPADVCALGIEGVSGSVLPVCRDAITGAWLDGACAFGARYPDLFTGEQAVIVVSREVLTSPEGLDALAADQIIRAVHETAHDDVTTLEQAFSAVDEGLVNRAQLWDASNRVAYTAIEVGAGDNSFGALFRSGTTEVAARIIDGDLTDCLPTWGPEHRRCTSDAACPAPARCEGASDASPQGRCRTPALDTHPGEGAACGSDAACPLDGGLLCQGAALSGEGLCGPAWMRGRFASRPGVAIPDNAPGGAAAQVLVYGLATVSTDVRLDLLVSHPRSADLRIVLTNPAGTEAVVADGVAAANGELWLANVPVAGFPGDESANGVWTVTAVDRKSGKAGTLQAITLEITSRWD